MMRTAKRCVAAGIVACALGGGLASTSAEILVKDGQKVAFLGDSITAGGWGNPGGYVRLVVAGLAANGIKVTPVPAGVSGHKSNQMLERLGRDVLDKHPDWMTLSCGVNDVWHGAKGVPLDQYKTNISAILDKCQAAGVKVMVLTATVIGEELESDNNRKLAAYNEFLRGLARERKCPLADLNALFQEAIKAGRNPGRVLTSDGVHMNGAGDQLMARGVLRAFGLSDAQLAKALDQWLDIAEAVTLQSSYVATKGKVWRVSHRVSIRQEQRLRQLAAQAGQTPEDLLSGLLAAEARTLLKPSTEFESFEEILRAGQEKESKAALQEKFARKLLEMLK